MNNLPDELQGHGMLRIGRHERDYTNFLKYILNYNSSLIFSENNIHSRKENYFLIKDSQLGRALYKIYVKRLKMAV